MQQQGENNKAKFFKKFKDFKPSSKTNMKETTQDSNDNKVSNNTKLLDENASIIISERKINDDEECCDENSKECERLLGSVKQTVKQLMEEAVTKRILHVNSPQVLSFCVAVDACLSHKIKRRALGLFKSPLSTCALIRKVSKNCIPAAKIISIVDEKQLEYRKQLNLVRKQQQKLNNEKSNINYPSKYLQITDENKLERNNWIRLALIERHLISIIEYLIENSSKYYEQASLMSSKLYSQILTSLLVGPSALDIKREEPLEQWKFNNPSADELINRRNLANPVACFYESDSCCLNNTSLKRLNANHLTHKTNSMPLQLKQLNNKLCLRQRRRSLALRSSFRNGALITNCHHYSCQQMTEIQPTRGYSLLNTTCISQEPHIYKANNNMNNSKLSINSNRSCSINSYTSSWPQWSPRLLHETLHQNPTSLLIYAKNNVILDIPDEFNKKQCAGYLSLHQTSMPPDIILKWIPNKMINGVDKKVSNPQYDNSTNSNVSDENESLVESSYLDFFVSLSMSKISLMYCRLKGRTDLKKVNNHDETDPESLGLVEIDGVHRTPFKFPKAGLQLFLSCLDNGLRNSLHMCLESTVVINDNDRLKFQSDLESIEHLKSSNMNDLNWSEFSKLKASTDDSVIESDIVNQYTNSNRYGTNGFVNQVFRIVPIDKYEHKFSSPANSESTATPSVCSESTSTSGSSFQITSADSNASGVKSRTSHFRWSLSQLTRFSSSSSSSRQVSSPTSNLSNQKSFGTANSECFISEEEIGNQTFENFDSCVSDLARYESKVTSLTKRLEVAQRLASEVSHSTEMADSKGSVSVLCQRMRKQITARAFYGWLAYCRKLKLVRSYLSGLLLNEEGSYLSNHAKGKGDLHKYKNGLNWKTWNYLTEKCEAEKKDNDDDIKSEITLYVYYGGIASNELRRIVWPYLLGLYEFELINSDTKHRIEKQKKVNMLWRKRYLSARREWSKLALVVRENEARILAHNIAKVANQNTAIKTDKSKNHEDSDFNSSNSEQNKVGHNVTCSSNIDKKKNLAVSNQKARKQRRQRLDSTGSVDSNASITDQFGNNLNRIDKDVQRCDRNYVYFREEKNLEKLRELMSTYVWLNLDTGYVQGMCDLAAPILVLFDGTSIGGNNDRMDVDSIYYAFACFSLLMEKAIDNFPASSKAKDSIKENPGISENNEKKTEMDKYFELIRYLMQVFDPKLFEILLLNSADNDIFSANGVHDEKIKQQQDCFNQQLYFCYRWLLLDFKREFKYEHVFLVWETIWAARSLTSTNFVVFVAFALIRNYRDVIIENKMDYTDTIKFFNEMAERHDAVKVLKLARDCVIELNLMLTKN